MRQMKINNKLMLISLLILFLLLTSYLSAFEPQGFLLGNHNSSAVSPSAKVNEHSSMGGGLNIRLHDYMVAANTLAGSSLFSLRQAPWLGLKMNFAVFLAIVSAQMACFFFYSRLSDHSYTVLISSRLMIFIHKKDGKK